VKKRQRIVDESSNESQSQSQSDSNYDNSKSPSNERQRGKRGRRKGGRLTKVTEVDSQMEDEEDLYDSSKLKLEKDSSTSSNVHPKKAGRPPKKPRGGRGKRDLSSTNTSV
jgi:hypothetical protein